MNLVLESMKNKAYKYKIVALCSNDGTELTKSKEFEGKKQLKEQWDVAIISAPISLPDFCEKCKSCKKHLSNGHKGCFDIDYKIEVNKGGKTEVLEPNKVFSFKHKLKL